MKEKVSDLYRIMPPAYITHYQGSETSRVLRSSLSSPLEDGLQPIAVCQKAVRTEDKFLFLNEVGFFGLKDDSDTLLYRDFGDLAEVDRGRGGGLAIDLQKDFAPYAAFNAIASQHGLNRDRYMDVSASYLVIRFSNIALLMWDMDEKRARKLLENPNSNNPKAAFGVLVCPVITSSHEQLHHHKALAQAYRFLSLYARRTFPRLNIEFEPQPITARH